MKHLKKIIWIMVCSTFLSCNFDNLFTKIKNKNDYKIIQNDTNVLRVIIPSSYENIGLPSFQKEYFAVINNDTSKYALGIDFSTFNKELRAYITFNSINDYSEKANQKRIYHSDTTIYLPNKSFQTILQELKWCLNSASKDYKLSKIGNLDIDPMLFINYPSLLTKTYKDKYRKPFKYSFKEGTKQQLSQLIFDLPYTKEINNILQPYNLNVLKVSISDFYLLNDTSALFRQVYCLEEIIKG